MLGEGLADIPTIDEAARETFRIGMGPFALMNATGIPIAYHSTRSLGEALGEFYSSSAALAAQFEAAQPWDLEGAVNREAKEAVAERLLGVASSAAFGATIFALMPGHAETVLWIAGRSELMVTCLCLIAIIIIDIDKSSDTIL